MRAGTTRRRAALRLPSAAGRVAAPRRHDQLCMRGNDILSHLHVIIERPTLFVIDGHSQLYRAYHAIRGLTGPDGRSTNAVFGFVAMLRKLIDDHVPAAIVAAFDVAGPTFRDEIAADYKAHRAPMPPDLAEQIPWVHRATEALGVPVVTCEGFEADDVIGAIAVRAASAGYDTVIVTGDKDLLQLVGPGVRVFNPRDDGTWYDGDGVRERFGVPPDRVVDVLALMGDATDNIKGVPGIGEKGAVELVTRFGDVEQVLARAGEVQQKKYREALLAHADDARRSLELARIRTDVPIDVDLARFQYRGPDRQACYEVFSALGFRSLTKEFAPGPPAQAAAGYTLVVARGDLEAVVVAASAAGKVAVVPLIDGDGARGSLVGLAIASSPDAACYVPVAHRGLESASQLGPDEALTVLRPLLADAGVAKIGHDLKAALLSLARHDAQLAGLAFDTMLASYLLDADRADHSMAGLALEHLGYRAVTAEELRGTGARAVEFADVPAAAALTFAAERATLAWRLAGRLSDLLEANGLSGVFRELEMPLVAVLASIERAGILIDKPALASLGAEVERTLASLTARIHDLAGGPFNINSPKQLSDVLFERLRLPALKKTGKTKTASTSMDVLEELAASHELPRLVLEWRSVQKLKGTYIDALPALADPATGRIHTSFNQAVAATGRLSSSDPNLQNIPIRSELGRRIRSAFVAPEGSVLISADYSQIELRVLAHLSADEALVQAFARGDDIHDRTAMAVFGPSSGLDRYELRRRAKIVNYALIYGKTAFTLAKDIGVSHQAAQAFIDAYFAGYPGVRRYLDQALESARETRTVHTITGRRRLVPEITSQNGQVRGAAERAAVNMPIQGTAADILKRAMIDLDREIGARSGDWPGARMILTVHDELLFETPAEFAPALVDLIRERMEHAFELAVPLTVDIGVGRNWTDAKP